MGARKEIQIKWYHIYIGMGELRKAPTEQRCRNFFIKQYLSEKVTRNGKGGNIRVTKEKMRHLKQIIQWFDIWRVWRTHCQLGKASVMGTDLAVGVKGADGLSYVRLPGNHDSGVIAHRPRVCGPPIYIQVSGVMFSYTKYQVIN